MIQTFNKFSQSRIAKVFLIIVALSFGAFWGGSGFFNPKDPNRYVAQVGERQIDRGQFRAALDQAIEVNYQEKGIKLSAIEAIESGLADQVLQELIKGQLLDLEAESLGLQITDSDVLQAIHSIPAFKDESGKFSRERFERIVASSRMHEAEFVEMIRNNLKREQIVMAIGAGSYSPLILAEGVLKATHQTRQGATLLVDVKSMPEPASPSEQELEEFYNQNKNLFKLPETRSFTMVTIAADKFIKAEQLTDSAIKEEYQLLKPELGNKPLSEVKTQVLDSLKKKLSGDQMYELTQKLEDEIASGTSLEEVAKGNNLQMAKFDNLTREGVASNGEAGVPSGMAAAVMPQVFNAEEGDESVFFEAGNDGSNAVIRTDKITPEHIPGFAEAKKDVAKLWLMFKKNEAAVEKAKTIAQDINEKREMPVSMKLLPNVSLANEIKDVKPEVVDVLYQLSPGKATIIPVEGGYMVVMLKNIIPSNPIKSKAEEGEKAVAEQMKLDLTKAYINSLKIKYPARVNTKAIQTALGL